MNNPVKIILVEDDREIREQFKASYKDSGFQVIAAVKNSQDFFAIEKFEEADIVFIDYRLDRAMPESELNGIEIAEKLLENYSKKVIIFSANADDIDLAIEAQKIGVNAVIHKNTSLKQQQIIIHNLMQTEDNEIVFDSYTESSLFKYLFNYYKKNTNKTLTIERTKPKNYNLTDDHVKLLIGFANNLSFNEVAERYFPEWNNLKTSQIKNKIEKMKKEISVSFLTDSRKRNELIIEAFKKGVLIANDFWLPT